MPRSPTIRPRAPFSSRRFDSASRCALADRLPSSIAGGSQASVAFAACSSLNLRFASARAARRPSCMRGRSGSSSPRASRWRRSSARWVSSASARISRTMESWPRFASSEALAAIFVPSIAIVPTVPRPAASQSERTEGKRARRAPARGGGETQRSSSGLEPGLRRSPGRRRPPGTRARSLARSGSPRVGVRSRATIIDGS
jgi:hypothetical protein